MNKDWRKNVRYSPPAATSGQFSVSCRTIVCNTTAQIWLFPFLTVLRLRKYGYKADFLFYNRIIFQTVRPKHKFPVFLPYEVQNSTASQTQCSFPAAAAPISSGSFLDFPSDQMHGYHFQPLHSSGSFLSIHPAIRHVLIKLRIEVIKVFGFHLFFRLLQRLAESLKMDDFPCPQELQRLPDFRI